MCSGFEMVHNAMRRPKQNNGNLSALILIVLIIGQITVKDTHGLLLFPASTSLQVTSSISIPLDLPTRTKVFMDMGFQMNYNLPNLLSSFYNSTIWADELSRRSKRQLNSQMDSALHPSDITAGELYVGLEHMLENYGYHRSCLLRSVCELSLHPFAEDHIYGLVTQVITFLLTPSQHEGFGVGEQLYRDIYERAEQIGFLGGDCQSAYPSCEMDIVNLVTRIVR
ncbi:uncharacterized protein [Drosophila pseudoobscura]|uniref:N-acetyltransferase domain-containing protein n=1 Tax=Drosophila pseudoobscura pseudoobscura TaxID=46245 RepID=A0A6I8UQI7_DROPS|nr:uncharacterized protein LOC4802156 [Drosophila pseudoobscura]